MDVLDTWDARSLAERCHILRGSLGRLGVDDATLAAHWPGESEDLGAWIRCYAIYTGELRVAEHRKAARDAELASAITAALNEQPELVALNVPAEKGRAWMVYPKSFHALQFLDMLDVSLRELRITVAAVDASEATTEARTEVAALEPLLRSLAVRLWAWILTSEGCGLPFDDNHADVEPPEWTKQLSPEDLARIFTAHVAVNRSRLVAIAAAFPPEHESQSRLSLSGFIGSTAQELGRPARELLRKWSQGAVFAQVVTSSQASKEAMDAARDRS